MRPYPAYQPVPALLSQLLTTAGSLLIDRAQGVQEHPLGLTTSLAADVDVIAQPTLVVPTDLLITAWRQLFPPERMLLIGGRWDGSLVRATSVRDVTGDLRSTAYVKASAALLHESLLDWEATGAHLVGWIHSHPGRGAAASHPSDIDRRQDCDLRKTYGPRVVGAIVTQDGWLRFWGGAITAGIVDLQLRGSGVISAEMQHVYKLAVW